VSTTISIEPTPAIDEAKLLSLIATYKQKNDLQAPVKDKKLCDLAKTRLDEVGKDFSHDGLRAMGNSTFQYTGFNRISENLSRGYNEPNTVINAWKASPKHNEALLFNHPYACVECANINLTNYCVYLSASY